VWPITHEQRCWVHKTANILNKLPKSLHTKAKLDLPRFRGEMRAWDQAPWLYVMLSSGFVAFFSLAPGGAILPSRPAH
jgi:hypothetical protein